MAYELSWDEETDGPHLDAALLPRLMWEQWNETFRRTLGHGERSLVSELREYRDAGRIAEEVIGHLTGFVGARVRVTLEVEADIPAAPPSTWCGR